MKNKYIVCSLIILCLFTIVPFSSAQKQFKTIQDKGPMFITSASFLQGLSRFPYNVIPGEEDHIKNFKKANISLINVSQFMGFQFNPYFALGLGIGFDYWTVNNAFVPVYADLRFNLTKGKIAPYLYLNLGYANRWHIDAKPYKASTGNSNKYVIHGHTSGMLGELGLGMKASVGYSSAIVVTVSGRVQESSLRYYDGPLLSQSMSPLLVNTNSAGLYLFLGVKVGVVF